MRLSLGESFIDIGDGYRASEYPWFGGSCRFHGVGLSQDATAADTLGGRLDCGRVSDWIDDAEELESSDEAFLSVNPQTSLPSLEAG
jgi:hypothetical protein